MKLLTNAVAALLFSAQVFAGPSVSMQTSMGEILIELDQQRAPISVANFLSYVDSGFYNGLIFHRVIPGFMIQGGGMDADLKPRNTQAPIRNESNNGLSNARGTIAMARTSDPDSATAQFFINSVDNEFLNGSAGKAGYAVFGKVVEGMQVVDKISTVATGSRGYFRDVPNEPIQILSVQRLAD